MTPATRRRLARLLVTAMGVTRLVQGLAESLGPRRFLTGIGARTVDPGTVLGFRMKGGRDVALGVMTLMSQGDDRALAQLAVGAVVVDAVDGVGVALDRGRTFGALVHPVGAVMGVTVAVAAVWAARALTPDRTTADGGCGLSPRWGSGCPPTAGR